MVELDRNSQVDHKNLWDEACSVTTRWAELALVVGLAGWGQTFDPDWPDDAGVHAHCDARVLVRSRAPVAAAWQPAIAALPCGIQDRRSTAGSNAAACSDFHTPDADI